MTDEYNCTFALGNKSLLHQAIYICNDCHIDCCEGCAMVCHENHDIDFLIDGPSSCDCGINAANRSFCCQLIEKSILIANRLLELTNRNLALDGNCRILGTEDSGIIIPSYAVYKLEPISQNTLVDLQLQSIELVKYSKETFWCSYSDEPTCMFESLAKSIFHHYVSSCHNFDIHCSGVEWWVQVKSKNDIEENIRNQGIDLHYDKDEDIAAEFGVGLFPQISTVTYLSSANSIPTLIVSNTASYPVGDPINQAFVSFPEMGKHITFDGRFLHGAPLDMANPNLNVPSGMSSDFRVTFLANIWLNHHPANIKRFPLEFAHLSPFDANFLCNIRPNTNQTEDISITSQDIMNDTLGEWKYIPFISDKSVWGKEEDETGLSLKIWIPNSIYIKTLSNSSSYLNKYLDRECAATLEYEIDEEFMEEVQNINV